MRCFSPTFPGARSDYMAALAKLSPADSSVSARDELREIVRARSFRYGRYTLSSGLESNIYFNMKPTMMTPQGGRLSALEFLRIAAATQSPYVGGLEMGAVPVIGSMVALSYYVNIPVRAVFVRKAPKPHGTMDLVEGLGPEESLVGQSVLVVDDVATSGKSILKAVEAIRAAGGVVTDAACIVDREEGAAAWLAENRVQLHSVLHAREFLEPGQTVN